MKVKLYESLVMATMLYNTQLWPLTVKHMKTFEAANRKCQRRLMGIKWYDRLSNVEVRRRTESAKLEEMIREKKTQMARACDKDGGLQNTEPSFKLEPWRHEQEIRKASEKLAGHYPKRLKEMGLSWDDASELAHCRSSWRQRVAQCVDTVFTRVSGLRSV